MGIWGGWELTLKRAYKFELKVLGAEEGRWVKQAVLCRREGGQAGRDTKWGRSKEAALRVMGLTQEEVIRMEILGWNVAEELQRRGENVEIQSVGKIRSVSI